MRYRFILSGLVGLSMTAAAPAFAATDHDFQSHFICGLECGSSEMPGQVYTASEGGMRQVAAPAARPTQKAAPSASAQPAPGTQSAPASSAR